MWLKSRTDYKHYKKLRKNQIDVFSSDKVNLNAIAYEEKQLVKKYSNLTKYSLWETEKEMFLKYVDKNAYILIVACGCGRTTFGLHELGYANILSTDISGEMINEAKKICKAKKYNLNFQVCSMNDLPFEAELFDVVFVPYNALMMVPSLNSRMQSLMEFNRVLKKRGKLIFTASNRDANKNFSTFWKKEKKTWFLDNQKFDFGDQIFTECEMPVFIHFSTTKEIKKMLKSTGFYILEYFLRNTHYERDEIKNEFGNTMFFVSERR